VARYGRRGRLLGKLGRGQRILQGRDHETAARTPLGKLVSREFTSAQYASSLPGAPDGEYVVIQFATAFENKAASVETVTPMMDKDGKWRVSGYYIR
jgi:hypothetical protein